MLFHPEKVLQVTELFSKEQAAILRAIITKDKGYIHIEENEGILSFRTALTHFPFSLVDKDDKKVSEGIVIAI